SVLLLAMIKITFLTTLAGSLYFILFLSPQSDGRKWREILSIVIGCIIAFFAIFSVLSLSGALHNFFLILEWSASYAATMPLFAIETFRKIYFHLFPTTFLSTISPSYFVLAIAGIVLAHSPLKNSAHFVGQKSLFH